MRININSEYRAVELAFTARVRLSMEQKRNNVHCRALNPLLDAMATPVVTNYAAVGGLFRSRSLRSAICLYKVAGQEPDEQAPRLHVHPSMVKGWHDVYVCMNVTSTLQRVQFDA